MGRSLSHRLLRWEGGKALGVCLGHPKNCIPRGLKALRTCSPVLSHTTQIRASWATLLLKLLGRSFLSLPGHHTVYPVSRVHTR